MTNQKQIKTGADNYNNYLPLLNNKQIGIVTNQTGILSNKTHLVDFLLEKILLSKNFAPELFEELLMRANISLTERF
jgi:uncharacterized protein YbbC (DUF1343 family)